MSEVWEILDMEIAATPMPESYHNKKVSSIYYYTKYHNIYTLFAIDTSLGGMILQIWHFRQKWPWYGRKIYFNRL